MQRTHGEVRTIGGKRVATPEYRAWQKMRDRCLNPASKDYRYYGGRGIKICRRWLCAYENFLVDMGRRPSPLHTLDRRDCAKGYCKSNCRWATREVQARNRPYAKTKAWVLAERLGIATATARHMIMQVRAKDRGNTSWFTLSPAREAITRAFIKETHGGTV